MSDEQNDNSNNENLTPEIKWISQDGTFGDLETAPDGVGEFITNKGWKDLAAMTQSHRELESKLGDLKNMIKIPDDNDEVGQRALATRLGCPEKYEDYTYEAKVGDSMDKDLLNLFKQSAYKDGMPQKAFQDVVRFQLDAITAGEKAYADNMASVTDEAQKAIRERFNTEDEYDTYTQEAMGFAEQFKLSDDRSVMDVIEDKGLAYDPEILNMLDKLSHSVDEDSLPINKIRVTPDRDVLMKELQKDPAFTDALHPDHEEKMEEFWALHGMKKRG